ncbi:MAG: tetratricopeptide (TPR) repeat protein [Flammeovirgaceae bacterium]|jgi:tetratricopeptide (TPR) repeat protein
MCLFGTSYSQTIDEKIQDLLDQAEHLTLNNRVDDAIAIYDRIIAIDPKRPLAFYRKGELYISKGRFIDAIKSLESGVKIENPKGSQEVDKSKISEDYLSALELLGNLYSQLYKAKNAVYFYESAYNLDENVENKLRYQLEILSILFAVNRHTFAMPHVELAKKLQPNNFDVKFFEGQYYNEMGEFEKSFPLLESVVSEVEPQDGNEKYYFELGKAYFNLGKYKKAKEAFKNADGGRYSFLLKEYEPEYFYYIAQALFEVFEFDESEKYLKISLQLDPAAAKAHELNQKLAGIKQPKGKLIDAKKAAAESAEKEGKTTLLIDSYKDLAALYYQNGDYEFAIDAVQNWEALDKNINLYRILLKAMAGYKMGDPNESFIMLNKSVKNPRMPGGDKARFNVARGMIYLSQKKYKEASSAFKAAYKGSYKAVSRAKLNEIEQIKARSSSATLDDAKEGDEGGK